MATHGPEWPTGTVKSAAMIPVNPMPESLNAGHPDERQDPRVGRRRRSAGEPHAGDGAGGWRGHAGFGRLAHMRLATLFFFSCFYPTPTAVGRH
jgi:hypothetical protein